ncbi:hypothetical protein IMZ31_22245 (plasmid) [Pontibacillus sp. ALD_SL1]|uniref:hypothetical protein n=1 Tax=Pontibacillus sp. ALD_SL1 TaxID=2777185 RepID=UPI001A978CEA|nr:hypothetical protein [Pontibacillus sp. ALD_SL1]QST02176.1 hypothetical protein IMZ31_22245 [Pontibacillus sp. ALD_SL1]
MIREEFVSLNAKLWKMLTEACFGCIPESSVTITDKNEMISLLDVIGKHAALHNLYLPSGGDRDITGAAWSHEKGMLELRMGDDALIVNAQSLTFYRNGHDPRWWYIRLRAIPFQESGLVKLHAFENSETLYYYGEELNEIAPGVYKSFDGYDEDERIKRTVIRKVRGGDFVFFSKGAPYLFVKESTNALHNKMNEVAFDEAVRHAVYSAT